MIKMYSGKCTYAFLTYLYLVEFCILVSAKTFCTLSTNNKRLTRVETKDYGIFVELCNFVNFVKKKKNLSHNAVYPPKRRKCKEMTMITHQMRLTALICIGYAFTRTTT